MARGGRSLIRGGSAGRNYRAKDAHGLLRFFIRCGQVVDCLDRFHAALHASEGGECSIKMRGVAEKDEEVCRRAIGLGGARHRDNSARMFDWIRFVVNRVRGSSGKCRCEV